MKLALFSSCFAFLVLLLTQARVLGKRACTLLLPLVGVTLLIKAAILQD